LWVDRYSIRSKVVHVWIVVYIYLLVILILVVLMLMWRQWRFYCCSRLIMSVFNGNTPW